MKRRDFLGTIIGTVMINGSPLLAGMSEPAIIYKNALAEWLTKASYRDLYDCKASYVTNMGELKAPSGFKLVTLERNNIIWIFNDIQCSIASTAIGSKLMTPNGISIIDIANNGLRDFSPFSQPMPMMPGDVLKITCSVEWEDQ